MERNASIAHRIAGRLYDRRWAALGACLLLTAVAAVPALRVTVDNSIQRWFVEGDPALASYRSFQATYGNDETVLVALRRADGLLTPAGLEILKEATRALQSVEGVASVRSLATMTRLRMGLAGPRPVSLVPDRQLSAEQVRSLRARILADTTRYGRFVGEDGRTAAVLARMAPNDQIDGRRDVILGRIQDTLDHTLRGTDVRRHRAGVGVILRALNQASTQDAVGILLAANGLLVLLLWAFFRRLGPVGLTLGVVGMATVWLLGAYGWAGLAINTVTLVMPTLVLVVGTADCVHLLRHAADLPGALSPRERAVRTVGFLLRPCGVTTLTTALGFAVLAASPMPVVRHLGLFSALGLLCGFVAAVMGCTWGLAYEATLPVSTDRQGLRQWVGAGVGVGLRHPRAVLAGAVLLTLGAGWGIARISVDTNSLGYLPRDHPVREDARLIERALGPYAPLEFVVRADSAHGGPADVLAPRVFEAVRNWERAAVETGAVGWGYSAVDGVRRLHGALSGGDPALPERPERIDALVQLGAGDVPYVKALAAHPDRLRVTFGVPMQSADGLRRAIRTVKGAAALPDGVSLEATGYLPLYVRIMTLVVQSQLWTFGLGLVVILAAVGLLFRSVRAALWALVPNVLPVLLTLGVMGGVGLPLDVATVTIAAVLFGLVVDDTVHLLHRYAAGRTQGLAPLAAIQRAARTGGPMLVTTTCVIGGGLLVLTLAQVKSVVWFGGLTALGVGLALVVDLLVLPALIACADKLDSLNTGR
ncbi:MAG: RND family transporter [Salinibacter sp.]